MTKALLFEHTICISDLVSDPLKSLKYLNEKLEISLTTPKNIDFTIAKNHGIAGNISRFKSTTIRTDFAYKTKFPKILKFITQIICYPMSRKLDY